MKKILISIGSVSAVGLPVLAFAQKTDYIDNLLGGATSIVQKLVVFLISLAVVWFIWNVVQYSMSSEEDGKEKAKSQMINGIIAIAVIVSIWGLVAILRGLFGTENSSIPNEVYNMVPGQTNTSGGSNLNPNAPFYNYTPPVDSPDNTYGY